MNIDPTTLALGSTILVNIGGLVKLSLFDMKEIKNDLKSVKTDVRQILIIQENHEVRIEHLEE